MPLPQALLLGLVQGLTEFLPVSSTAHLRLVPFALGWHDPGAAFSAVVQLGSLAAVLAYFAADIGRLLTAGVQGLVHRDLNRTADTRLAWSIVAGTVPIASLGLLFRDFVESGARDLRLIACSLIGLAVLLLVAERLGRRHRGMADLGFWSIQFIGLCQALALVPGSSRSGCTIMAGLFAGLTRDEAARFSFLLSLPAVAASGLLELAGLMRGGLGGEGMVALAVGVVAAAVSSYLSIDFLLRFLRRHGTYVFAHYRIALGALILWAAH